jgi:hypothetical protein
MHSIPQNEEMNEEKEEEIRMWSIEDRKSEKPTQRWRSWIEIAENWTEYNK